MVGEFILGSYSVKLGFDGEVNTGTGTLSVQEISTTLATTPEPSTLVLFGTGALLAGRLLLRKNVRMARS
ncbi:MAG: PEP-CTERM sorting domain-containing protein [Nitrospirae bacterium]|nr:PEP-CTERM sorting domain-containing protein [Nitrospirota bacterium]